MNENKTENLNKNCLTGFLFYTINSRHPSTVHLCKLGFLKFADHLNVNQSEWDASSREVLI